MSPCVTSLRFSLTARWSRAIFCAILLGVTPLCALHHFHDFWPEAKPPLARMTPAQVKARALTFSAAFELPCQILGSPVYRDEVLDPAFGRARHRHFWSVNCASQGSLFIFRLNDATGNLSSMNYGGELQGEEKPESNVALLATEKDAVAASLRHLRDLQMVAPEKQIALDSPPRLVNAGEGWQVTWRVRDSAQTPPYRIRLLLARAGGVPIQIVNQHEIGMLSEN